jgi:RNA methyltransferase, TrmH family
MRLSRQHPFVKACRAVAAGRGDEDVVLLDGDHLIAEALAAGVPLQGVLTSDPSSSVAREAAARGVLVLEAARDILDAASPVRSPSGIVALASWAPARVEAVVSAPAPLVLGLLGVQDPGNVGSIIRSADALGATGVVALEGTASPAGWKALRGAMGSTFRVAVATADVRSTLAAARRAGVRVAATVPQSGTAIDQAALSPPLFLLLGSEGEGLPPDVVAQADTRLTIPMRPGTNSLNVGVSAALMLWEARRHSAALR